MVHHLELAAGEARVERFTSGSDAEGATASRPLTKWVIATRRLELRRSGPASASPCGGRSELRPTTQAASSRSSRPAARRHSASYRTAVASQIAAFFPVSGALAVTAVVLLVLDRKAASAARQARGLSFTCVPGRGSPAAGRLDARRSLPPRRRGGGRGCVSVASGARPVRRGGSRDGKAAAVTGPDALWIDDSTTCPRSRPHQLGDVVVTGNFDGVHRPRRSSRAHAPRRSRDSSHSGRP